MRFEWDPAKNRINRYKHEISFEDVRELFTDDSNCLEIFDEAHSTDEDRFIAIGPTLRGFVVVSFSERPGDITRIVSARRASRSEVRLFEQYCRGQR